ncbi:MAG: hypothetical protein RL757_2271 [Bacteroidota bacterium]|jgi:hypothetical protein
MQKISNLKAQLGANACLSADESHKIKGGITGSITYGGTTLAINGSTVSITVNGTTSSVNLATMTEDDKRRERPGGLTSQ